MHPKSVRMVRQLDGTLVQKTGRVVPYKKPKTFDDYLRQAVFQGYYSHMTVRQAYAIARQKAEADGVETLASGAYPLPAAGAPEWDYSVRRVYPSQRPRGAK